MKIHRTLYFAIALLFCTYANAQKAVFDYKVSSKNPFGMLNPEAPKEVADYAPLIGACDCKSFVRNKDKSWADALDMQWTFKYIMNGFGVQDETLKSDGGHSGSIRQYNVDSARWYVHYYSNKSPSTALSAWEGGMKENEIILYKNQAAPNGTEGFYKIRFYNISKEGFNWVGAWVNLQETFSYETWKIECKKRL